MMTPENFDKWIAALRSGDYSQARGQLRFTRTDYQAYCCLGLYCEIVGFDLSDSSGFFHDSRPWGETGGVILAPYVLKRDIAENQRSILAKMNDSGGTFSEIADYLEVNKEDFVK